MGENKKSGARASRTAWLTAYCVGNVGYEMLYEFFKNFQNFFLTELCHFSTTLTATLITIVNICKAIFTPISGMIIDSDPFKARDKHTPWILGMPVLLGGLYILMALLAWKGGSPTLIIVLFAIFYFLPVLLQNGYRSAIPSLSMNSNETGFLAAGINTASNVGRLLTGIIVPVIMVKMSADGKTEDAQGFFWAVVISVIITIAVYWISALGVKKSIRPDRVRGADVAKAAGEKVKKNTVGLGKMIKQIFTDKNILIPFVIGLGVFFRTFIVSPTAPYYFKYITGNMMQYATFSTATNIAGIASVIIAPIILATIGRNNVKGTILTFLGIQILCHLSLQLVGDNTILFIVAMTIGQFFYQGTSVLLFTAFVNAVDVTELKNRKAGNKDVASGTAMSLHFTAVMFAQVLGGYLRNFALKQAGYVGAETVASAALTKGLVNLYTWWPVAFLAIAVIATCFYNLTPAYMKEVHAELDPMRAAETK